MAKKAPFIPLLKADQLATYLEYLGRYEKQVVVSAALEAGIPIDFQNHIENGYVALAVAMKWLELITKELSNESLVKMIVACCKINAVKLTNGRRLQGTVREALTTLGEQVKFDSTDTSFKFNNKFGEELYYLDRVEKPQKGAELITVLMMVNFVQLLLGHQWQPKKIQLRGNITSKIDAAFKGSEIEFIKNKTYTGVQIPSNLLDMEVSLPMTDAILTSYHDIHTFKYSLKTLLEPYISGTIPTVNEAASYANMSVRTLQRRLSNEGCSYTDVIFELLDELTCDALINTDESITDISYRLGYSHSSHLIRAFKKKFELTPNQFRKKYRQK